MTDLTEQFLDLAERAYARRNRLYRALPACPLTSIIFTVLDGGETADAWGVVAPLPHPRAPASKRLVLLLW